MEHILPTLHIFGFDFIIRSSYIGVLAEIFIIGIFIALFHFKKKSKISIIFELLYEEIYKVFEEILGEHEKKRVKSTIVSLFFVVFISNFMGLFVDSFALARPTLEHYITIPTSDKNFDVALAIFSVVFVLFMQAKKHGFIHFVHEYIPITGKKIIDVEKGTMNPFVYYPMKVVVKLFDIIISLFIGILDIIGNLAKLISLSHRLWGNMLAGTILLGMLVAGTNGLSQLIAKVDFPFLLPIILLVQGLLVAVVQAFVISLLTAIFVKIVQE
ncbi:hypothetical protein P148_SR1C00001G0284 [candidate division SR1 bacterium RAAC1_SR1_1]|nr:hypothetical protein P148_SR1C00001G0284 [candidate division SR1 bacterium RAAC1_SR1_1]